jgi:long-subunit fatty acid transport protein
MNTYKSLIAGLALLGWAGNVSAQNETDALRYSRTFLSGTARIQGLAGAQAAIGADIGSLAGNPAGLGLFRRSEFSFTPAINMANTSSRVLGAGGAGLQDGARSNFNLPSIGVVIADRKDDAQAGDWRSGNFGLGFTRLNNFNAEANYGGTTQSPNTIVRSFGEMAIRNQRTFDDLENEFGTDGRQIFSLEGLAYATYLLDVDNQGNFLLEPQAGIVTFGEQISRFGAQNQFDISYGTSYRDRIFIGGSIGISTVNFTQERTFRESDDSPQTDFQRLLLRDEFSTRGAGVNARLGVIFRPSDQLRFGATVQTPTLFALTDRYTTLLSVDYDPGFLISGTNIVFRTAPGEFEYRLTTPLRATVGAAYFLGKNGFVTADVEYVNHASARLSSRDADGFFTGANDAIRNTYSPTINFKLGGEARVNIFRFRAGYALFGDPAGSGGNEGARSFLTGGAGIRVANYSVDLGLTHGWGTELYSPYTLNNRQEPLISTNIRPTQALLTFGLNF